MSKNAKNITSAVGSWRALGSNARALSSNGLEHYLRAAEHLSDRRWHDVLRQSDEIWQPDRVAQLFFYASLVA